MAALPWLTASMAGSALSAPQAAGLAPFAARGTGTGDPRQSGRPRRHLERRSRFPAPRNGFRGRRHRGAAGRGGLRGSGAGTPPGHRTAGDAGCRRRAAACGDGHRPGHGTAARRCRPRPGLAVVRDGQKWVALAMPGYALAGAAAVLVLGRRMRPALVATACLPHCWRRCPTWPGGGRTPASGALSARLDGDGAAR